MLTCTPWTALLLVSLAVSAAQADRRKTACSLKNESLGQCVKRDIGRWPTEIPDFDNSAATCSFMDGHHCQYRQGCTDKGEPVWTTGAPTVQRNYNEDFMELRSGKKWPSGAFSVYETPPMTVPHPSCLSVTASVYDPVSLDVLLESATEDFCVLSDKWTKGAGSGPQTVHATVPGGPRKILAEGRLCYRLCSEEGEVEQTGYARLYNVSLMEGCCPDSAKWSTLISNMERDLPSTDCDWEHGNQWKSSTVREQIVETKGKQATLTTPMLRYPPAGAPGCVNFSFHIPETTSGSLVVSIVLPSHVQTVWKVESTSTTTVWSPGSWTAGQLPVTQTSERYGRNFRIRFTADRKGSLPIALANVEYTAEPHQSCKFLPPGAEITEDENGNNDNKNDKDKNTSTKKVTSSSAGEDDDGHMSTTPPLITTTTGTEHPDVGLNALFGIAMVIAVIIVCVIAVALGRCLVRKTKKGRRREAQNEPLADQSVTSNYEMVDDVTNGNCAVPTAERAGPGVTSPQSDGNAYNHLNLAGRSRGAPCGDPLRHRGPREDDYNGPGDVIPGGPPQAASTAKKEGASASNVYFELEADGQLSTRTTVAQSAAEDPYNRLGAVKRSNPPPQSGGATPHRAYDHVVPAREEGAYDVAQIGQRKKKSVIDFNYHQLEAFSKGK